MLLDLNGKIELLNKLAQIHEILNRGNAISPGLLTAILTVGDEVNALITVNAPSAAPTVEETKAEAPPAKKETAPKSAKKVTAAGIIEDKPVEKPVEIVSETKVEAEEISLTDDEDSLIGDEPQADVLDYEALRTECRALINSAVDRVGKPAVVAILDYIHAKSLKDVKDTLLPWLRTKLTEAK